MYRPIQQYVGLRAASALAMFAALVAAPMAFATPHYTLGPTTLRNCGRGASAGDPINVFFVGPAATWQNSMRLVGQDLTLAPSLKWRTTSFAAGGTQSIMDTSASNGCVQQQGQSARGVFHKHHTRYFQQAAPLFTTFGTPYLVTGQDAHRDVKSDHCAGSGSYTYYAFGGRISVNDRVPIKDNGFTDGGYNQAQREFLNAFANRQGRAFMGPGRHLRFFQCAGEPTGKYTVGWNGVLQSFDVPSRIDCGDKWHVLFFFLGECPSDG